MSMRHIYELYEGELPSSSGCHRHRCLIDSLIQVADEEVRLRLDTGGGAWIELRASNQAMRDLAEEMIAAAKPITDHDDY